MLQAAVGDGCSSVSACRPGHRATLKLYAPCLPACTIQHLHHVLQVLDPFKTLTGSTVPSCTGQLPLACSPGMSLPANMPEHPFAAGIGGPAQAEE